MIGIPPFQVNYEREVFYLKNDPNHKKAKMEQISLQYLKEYKKNDVPADLEGRKVPFSNFILSYTVS